MYQSIVEELWMRLSEIVEAFEEEYQRLAFIPFVFKIKRESGHGFYPPAFIFHSLCGTGEENIFAHQLHQLSQLISKKFKSSAL